MSEQPMGEPIVQADSLAGSSIIRPIDHSRSIRVPIPVCIFAALSFVGNILLPQLFWHVLPEWILVAMAAVGCVASQVAMLALWAGLGSGWLSWRMLCCGSLVLVVCGSYVVGLQVPEFPNPTLPGFIALFIFAAGCIGFALATLSLFGMANLFRVRISRNDYPVPQQSQGRQLSIAYVFGITTAVAVAVALLPQLIPDSERSIPANELLLIGLMTTQHFLFCLVTMWLSSWAILAMQRNLLYLVCLIALFAILTTANLWLLALYPRVQLDTELILAVVGFNLGFTLYLSFMLGMLRWLGFRLRRNPDQC